MSVAVFDKQIERNLAAQPGSAAFDLFVQAIRPIQGQNIFTWGEVLLRSRRGDQSCAPGPVLRHAAEQGLAMELDLLIIAETAQDLRHTGIDLLSVNVSGQSVSRPEFFELVAGALEQAHVGFERFCFEITESEPVDDLSVAREFCTAARNAGALIALDDFGTGHSNIQLCSPRFVDVLKICQSLVEPLQACPDELAIVDGLVALAGKLDMLTVAEGVESEEQLSIVRNSGVDYAQGFVHQGEAVPVVRFALQQEA